MNKTLTILSMTIIFVIFPAIGLANSAPVVSNVTAAQRDDNSKLVDIHYDLVDADGDYCTVWILVSDNDGVSWSVPAMTLTGHIGHNIAPGNNKHIIWDAGADMPGRVGTYKVRVFADDGKGPADMVLVPAGAFPYQNSMTLIFVESFLIDKYEVTNQFYCQFLNNACPDGSHWNNSMEISRVGNSAPYYYTVFPGRENYPIRYVLYSDASAFAEWRGTLDGGTYRVPTGPEWEKAAAWDPVQQHYYTYGFHSDSIDCSWCNYNGCVGAFMPVGSYNGTGGRNDAKSYYGCYDMSGNVAEWTTEPGNGSCYNVRPFYLLGGTLVSDVTSCRNITRAFQLMPNNDWRCMDIRDYSECGFRLIKEVK